jgi:hypothetical protein
MAGGPGGPYHWDMGLVEWLFKTSSGASALSAAVCSLAGIAILAFDAPPALFIIALWGAITAYVELGSRIDRRSHRH